MQLRQTSNLDLVKQLHAQCLPDDDWEDATQHWALWNDAGRACGFCSVYRLKYERGVYLSRAGVLPGTRGRGLQRRMIQARLRWARTRGLRFAVTYTSLDNYPSIVNLLRCGFVFYDPATPWAGPQVHYFMRRL